MILGDASGRPVNIRHSFTFFSGIRTTFLMSPSIRGTCKGQSIKRSQISFFFLISKASKDHKCGWVKYHRIVTAKYLSFYRHGKLET